MCTIVHTVTLACSLSPCPYMIKTVEGKRSSLVSATALQCVEEVIDKGERASPNDFAVRTPSLNDVWHEPVHNFATGNVSFPAWNSRTKASLEVEQDRPAKNSL